MISRIDDGLANALSIQGDRSEVMLGWMTFDEIEAKRFPENYPHIDYPELVNHIRRFNQLLAKQTDRLVISNHSYDIKVGADGGMEAVDDEWAWCSVLGINSRYGNKQNLDDSGALLQAIGHPSYIVVNQAHFPLDWLEVKDLTWYGFSPKTQATVDALARISVRDGIVSTYKVAYADRYARGIMYYTYDNQSDDRFKMTTATGEDYLGRKQAAYEAARIIRGRQGWPECRIIKPEEGSLHTGDVWVEVDVKPHGGAIKEVHFDYSVNGGRSFKYAGVDFSYTNSPPWGTWIKRPAKQLTGSPDMIIRARAWDGDHWSIIDAVRVLTQ
jgi:hypothetical protein